MPGFSNMNRGGSCNSQAGVSPKGHRVGKLGLGLVVLADRAARI